MRTFAQKPKTTQQTTPAKSTTPGRAHFGQSREVNSILHLQRTIGNQAVQRMLQTDAEKPERELTGTASPRFGRDFSRIPIHPPAAGAIQTKFAINKPGDIYEQEADRVSEQVMRMTELRLQRTCACGGGCPKCQTEQPDQEHERLQTKRVGSSDLEQTPVPPIVHEVLRSPGEPLDARTRALFELRFGHDFSRVRVHTGASAAVSARSVGALAYTVGRNIVFGDGEYRSDSEAGGRLLSHELVHVVQQNAGRAPSTLQRDTGTQKEAATNPRASTRPGAAWSYGPVTKSKSAEHDLTRYLAWVREVERAYGPDKQAVLQRLRRLYYSTDVGALGAAFDVVIADQAGAEGVPLDTLGISTEALDGLYETGTVRTPTGDVVDVTHVFAALDLKTAGATSKGAAAELLYDVRLGGVLTWVGDLAWWFVQWVERRSDLDATPSTEPVTEAGPSEETGGLSGGDLALMDELAKSKTSKDDLLGDMDATVMAEENVRPSTVEHVEAESRRIIYKNIDTELSMPVSQILEQYYSIGKGTAKPDESQQRFPNFVRKATPPIPHTTTGTGTVALAADAETAIYTAIGNVANLFMSRMSRGTSDDSDPLTKYDMILREMARRFTRFLGTGLAKGDAPWP